jgi:hypothetical protein
MHVRRIGRVLAALVMAGGLVARPAGQGKGGGVGQGSDVGSRGTEAAVMGSESARAMTPFEQFADKLKLDEKTQIPAAREVFLAAARDAGPVGVEMLQLREKLLNVTMAGSAADLKQTQDAYEATAAKMAGIEAATFAKVYALLKPNQQSKAQEAFAVMMGVFQSQGGARGGGGRRGGR